LVLAQYFHAYSALPGDDIWVIKWMDESELAFFLQRQCIRIGIAVAVAMQHDFH
jgi:hypothetical protein